MNPQAVPVRIEGVRVRLDRVTPADAPALFALLDDAEVMRFLDWPRPAGVHDTRHHLDGADERWARGLEHQYLVRRKADGAVAGSIAFRPRGPLADIGCVFGRAFWGQGLAREAAGLVVGWLKRQPHIQRIWASCDPDNHRSQRVLEAAGLAFEARLRRAALRPNIEPALRDQLIHAWVRGDEPEETHR